KSSSRDKPPAATPSRKNPGSMIRPASPGRHSSPPVTAPTMAMAAASAPRASLAKSPVARRKRNRRPHAPAPRRERAVTDRPYNVLFLCTGNSARSIIPEAILNKVGAGTFRGYSAGSHPKDRVHTETLKLLQSLDYDIAPLRSKSWDEFAGSGAP